MHRNCVAVSCLALVIFLIAGSNDARIAETKQAKQVTCTGKVIDEQGRPIADVKVSLHEMIYDEATYTFDPKLLGQVQIGTGGGFSFEETVESNQYRYGYIVAVKEGLALGFDNWTMQDGNKELEIKLGQPKELSGIVVDEKDAPVSDAQVAVSMLALGEGSERKNLTSLAAPKLLTVNTDAAGKFTFTHIPARAMAEFTVEKSGKATVSTYKRSGEPYEKLHFTEGQKDIKLVLPVEAKIEGLVVEKSTGKPVGGVKVMVRSDQDIEYFRPKPVASNQDGTFSFSALTTDRYILELVRPEKELPDWVADPVEVITETGKTKSDIKIELSKGGVLEVKVTDATNKKPVEEAHVGVNSQASSRSAYSRSDKNGLVQIRLLPGAYQITNIYKQGYSRQRPQDTVTIEDGKTEHLEYELLVMPKITGVVRDEKDKPIEGVEMEICPAGGMEESVSDVEGRFEVIYDLGSWPSGRIPTMFLVGRHEERNLAAAVQVDENTREIEIKLEPAITMTGQIVDPNDKGIADAEVRTMLHGPQWGSTIGRKPAITDKDGKYEIRALPPERTYSVYARAEGYGESRGEEINTAKAVDNRLDMGKLTLALANLSISGMVVDNEDKPVVGASISCDGENQPYRNTQTDIEGKFMIEKVCAGKIRVSANKYAVTRLYGYIETEGGATDVRIVISQSPSAMRYEPRQPASLVGRPLPELKDVGVDLPMAETDGKMLLVCFFDMEQRPSRHYVTQLAKQAEQLNGKGVTIVAVQVLKMDQNALNQWKNEYNIPFPVGMVESDADKARFTWGIRSLPWLILTDSEHIIRMAGFQVNELNEKIGGLTNAER